MATQVDFYILSMTEPMACRQWLCKVIEKAYGQQRRIYIHAPSRQEAHAIDELLWTYNDISFIPHNMVGEGPEPPPPVQIGYEAAPTTHKDILINLLDTIPNFYSNFQRVLEVVPKQEEKQALARERYREYKNNTVPLTVYNV